MPVITAGFLVVAIQALGLATATSLTFSVAIGLAVVNLYMAGGLESIPKRVVGGVGAIVGTWTIITILVFAASTAVSLGFVTTYLVNVWLHTPRHQGADVVHTRLPTRPADRPLRITPPGRCGLTLRWTSLEA